ncbi:hypothetical protein EGW08_013459 [Elysia chlorotica]|uniref:EGF-like domain-containing protein n=1 Tax=Elysia chlorotica TaxID=188477 RepID=A0A3S0ZZ48_ELYCH|nr:hypothetical protein EGW08_013459 [Elysia chlorotica]
MIVLVSRLYCLNCVKAIECSERLMWTHRVYRDACETRGWDVGVINTNQEYTLIQEQVWNLLDKTDNAVWVSAKSDGSKGYWADEDIEPGFFWSAEPNSKGVGCTGLSNRDCRTTLTGCLPIQMTSYFSKKEQGGMPKLRDTCWWNQAHLLCMADVNECDLANPKMCPDHSFCVNTEGSYDCQCHSGFQKQENGQCQDMDECKVSTEETCSDHSTCVNTDGSYVCQCFKGFQMDVGGRCQDINECEATNPQICPDNSVCRNGEGSFTCPCLSGYLEDINGDCQDINECATEGPAICGGHSVCVNTDGSYECRCPSGFQKDSSGHCRGIP